MTGVLALVGGEPFSEQATFNRSLVEASGATEVLVLPTAAAYEHPDEVIEVATEYFGSFDVAVRGLDVVSRPGALDEHNAEVVRAASCIYVVGGSAMHARSVLIQSPVWDALVSAWQRGATVVGSDAGAQILCDPMVDSRGGAFTVGLGLVTGVAVVTERNTWSEEALNRIRELSAPDLVVIGVDEGSAAVRAPDGSWRAEGAGRVEAYLGDRLAELDELNR